MAAARAAVAMGTASGLERGPQPGPRLRSRISGPAAAQRGTGTAGDTFPLPSGTRLGYVPGRCGEREFPAWGNSAALPGPGRCWQLTVRGDENCGYSLRLKFINGNARNAFR